MKESLELKEIFPVPPSTIYQAWLNSEEHSEMTGGEAKCSDQVGDKFTAWDDYITGVNKSLKPNEEIIQSWRTTQFEESDEDSELVIRFKEIEGGCEVTLIHTNIPEGQTQYELGWVNHYFTPMKNYFTKLSS